MVNIHVILWIIIILSGLHLVYLILRNTVEGFNQKLPDTREKDLRKEITQYMTLANDTLCTAYKQILDQKVDENLPDDQKILQASDQDPDERHKAKAKAITDIAQSTMPMMPGPIGLTRRIPLKPIEPSKVQSLVFSVETTGFLFPCPPPTEPLQVPNNIDIMIKSTVDAFFPQIDNMKKKIEESLSCPKKETTTEKYIDYQMHYITEPFDDANADPNLAEQRIQVLQIKADALKKALLDTTFVTFITHIKTLKELKAKAESGTGSTNCSA